MNTFNPIRVIDILDFLYEHKYAGEDFNLFFDVDIHRADIDELAQRLDPEAVLNWVLMHETLARDLLIASNSDVDIINAVYDMSYEDLVDTLEALMEY